jgi:hypothetical protein
MMDLCQLGSVISYGHGKEFGVDLYEVDEVLNPYSVEIVKSNYGFFQLSDLILKQRLYLRLGYTGLLRRFRPGLITLFKIMRLIGR